MKQRPIVSLVCPMRNEGPFLLEWLAWHRMIGFDDILVLTNDCTDGSEELLSALAARGFVRHIRHVPPVGIAPLHSAYTIARHDKITLRADWVMALDADEFLQIFAGNGSVQALLGEHGHDYLGMAIFWRTYGNNGLEKWKDKFLRHQFTRASKSNAVPNNRYKSIFRDLKYFNSMTSHSPRGFTQEWGNKNVWCDCEGQPIPRIRLKPPIRRFASLSCKRITHKFAQINHYAVKSDESFALKRTTLSGANLVYRFGDRYYEDFNRNEIEDTVALSREKSFSDAYDELTSDPEIVRMHHICCANYVRELCRVAGQNVEMDARFIHHNKSLEALAPV